MHPAWNPDSPPTVLELYDDRIYPACRPCMNDNLDFLYLPLGQVLRDMNSVLGVPYSDYAVMVRSSESCRCCLNHFSPHGYEHHRREGLCTNHPKLESGTGLLSVPLLSQLVLPIQFRPVKNSMKQTYADARSVKTQGLFSRGKHWKQLLVVHCWHGTPDLGFQPMFGY